MAVDLETTYCVRQAFVDLGLRPLARPSSRRRYAR